MEHVQELGKLRLYLDDLEELYTILRERTLEVGITAGEAVADKPSDLRHAVSYELRGLKFVTKNPNIVVILGSREAFVRTVDDSDAAQAIVAEVKALLRSKHYRMATFVSDFAASFVLSLVTFVLLIVTFFAVGLVVGQSPRVFFENLWESAPTLAGFVVGFPLMRSIILSFRVPNAAKIIPERRGSARHTTAYTRHTWMVSIVSVVLTVIGTAVVTYLIVR